MFTFMPCTSDHLSFFFSHRVFSPGTTCLLRACRKKKKKNVKSTAGAAMSALHRQ